MPETGLSVPIVTDHAVLRFIEHVHGIDTDAIRLIIANRCEAGVRYGASAVVADGMRFILRGDAVVTCNSRHWLPRTPGKGER
ncbi:hypothetical protein TM49_13720 [Martelella endophytica]|uniref:Uncharacterized protein n=2 Tax=Martelella endophytica TaxID=1486262 RepID=A0A0D5LV93_MAREN|nr:hypothetical protein TM49_13720 [Martelella endophytica]